MEPKTLTVYLMADANIDSYSFLSPRYGGYLNHWLYVLLGSNALPCKQQLRKGVAAIRRSGKGFRHPRIIGRSRRSQDSLNYELPRPIYTAPPALSATVSTTVSFGDGFYLPLRTFNALDYDGPRRRIA